MSYAVTYRCNLKCRMCNIWKKDRGQNELTPSDVDAFFAKAAGFSWVGITGGEPFLRDDLGEIIAVIMKRSASLNAIHFATNAQLPERIFAAVKRIRNGRRPPKIVFTISIDGPSALHDRIRGTAGAWRSAVETFRGLKREKGVKAQIGYTISKDNLGAFEETFAAVKAVHPALSFDDINVNVFQRSSFYYENTDMAALPAPELKDQIQRILDADKDPLSINNFLRRTYLRLYSRFQSTGQCPVKCQALSSTCFMDPAGDLYPCAVYKKKLINIKEMTRDFKALWNSPEARRLAYECSRGLCPSCWSPCDAFSAIGGALLQAVSAR
jgi:radical SAM protein with 4Fe4S-binding SPASM domain